MMAHKMGVLTRTNVRLKTVLTVNSLKSEVFLLKKRVS